MSAYDDLTEAQKRVIVEETFNLDEQFTLPMTNNYERVQDGVHLYELGTWVDALAESFARVRDAK